MIATILMKQEAFVNFIPTLDENEFMITSYAMERLVVAFLMLFVLSFRDEFRSIQIKFVVIDVSKDINGCAKVVSGPETYHSAYAVNV